MTHLDMNDEAIIKSVEENPDGHFAHIVSDGTPMGTHVEIDGKKLRGVKSITFDIDGESYASVTLEMLKATFGLTIKNCSITVDRHGEPEEDPARSIIDPENEGDEDFSLIIDPNRPLDDDAL